MSGPSKEAMLASWMADFGNVAFHGGPPGDDCIFCQCAMHRAAHFDAFAAQAVKDEREELLENVWRALKAALPAGSVQGILNDTIDAIRARSKP